MGTPGRLVPGGWWEEVKYIYLSKSSKGLHSASSKTSLLRWSPKQSVCVCFKVFVCRAWIWI